MEQVNNFTAQITLPAIVQCVLYNAYERVDHTSCLPSLPPTRSSPVTVLNGWDGQL